MEEELEIETRSVRARWGPAVAAGGYGTGWTPVPFALIKNIGELGLRPTDVTVLLGVLAHYWSRKKMPIPRASLLSKHLGLSRRTIERTLARLEDLGLIVWEKSEETAHGKRRVIQLEPLINKVEALAEESLSQYHWDVLADKDPNVKMEREFHDQLN